jgi:hypothetical protein
VKAGHDLHQPEGTLLAGGERVEARLDRDDGQDQHRIEAVAAALAIGGAHDVRGGAFRDLVPARDHGGELIDA